MATTGAEALAFFAEALGQAAPQSRAAATFAETFGQFAPQSTTRAAFAETIAPAPLPPQSQVWAQFAESATQNAPQSALAAALAESVGQNAPQSDVAAVFAETVAPAPTPPQSKVFAQLAESIAQNAPQSRVSSAFAESVAQNAPHVEVVAGFAETIDRYLPTGAYVKAVLAEWIRAYKPGAHIPGAPTPVSPGLSGGSAAAFARAVARGGGMQHSFLHRQLVRALQQAFGVNFPQLQGDVNAAFSSPEWMVSHALQHELLDSYLCPGQPAIAQAVRDPLNGGITPAWILAHALRHQLYSRILST